MTDLGYDIVVAPGGAVSVLRKGAFFEVRGADAAPPDPDKPPWTPPPWDFPKSMVAVLGSDASEMVAALDVADLAVARDDLDEAPPSPEGVDLVGAVTGDRVSDAFVAPNAGETLQVHVTGSVLDLDAFWPKIEQARRQGGRVEFLVVPHG